jgi:hypothetical protein
VGEFTSGISGGGDILLPPPEQAEITNKTMMQLAL